MVSSEKVNESLCKVIMEFRDNARIRVVFKYIDHLEEKTGVVTVCLR